MKDLSELRIYRLAVEISEIIWTDVIVWESFAKWTVGKQLVEASDGIAATMMEGYYRFSPAEQRNSFNTRFHREKKRHCGGGERNSEF